MKNILSYKKLVIALAAVAFLAAGCNQNANQNTNNSAVVAPTPTPTAVAQQIAYDGVEGKNALDLLKSKYKVETQEFSGVGEFVKSINGVTPDEKHFWAFYINGQSATVGAGQYVTKATDKIEWKLEEIK